MKIIKFFGSILLIILLLFCLELTLTLFDNDYQNIWWKFPSKSTPPIAFEKITKIESIETPFDVTKRSNYYNGNAPWEDSSKIYQSFSYKSDFYGFYNDYDLNNINKKIKNEFRIILIGGSGAQGNGASSNDTMLYRVLERKLNKSIKNKSIKIYNLALAGYRAHNFDHLLRTFGHQIEPDLILVYAGANDFSFYPEEMEKKYCNYYINNRLVHNFYNDIEWINSLGVLFPEIIYKYGLGTTIKKLFYYDYIKKIALNECMFDQGVAYDYNKSDKYKKEFYELITKKIFVNSLKNIKRDFMGIPIVLAFQSINYGDRENYERKLISFNELTAPIIELHSLSSEQISLTTNLRSESNINNIKLIIKEGDNPEYTMDLFIKTKFKDNIIIPKKYFGVSPTSINYKIEFNNTNKNDLFYKLYDEKEVRKFRLEFGLYQELFKLANKELENYYNKKWKFINVDYISEKNTDYYSNLPKFQESSISVHLDDFGHEIVSEIIANELIEFINAF